MFKIVCLFPFGHFQTTIGIAVVLCKSARCIIRAHLTIGISAVVYFFASTGNFPCKYNNQLKLVLWMHKKINTEVIPRGKYLVPPGFEPRTPA